MPSGGEVMVQLTIRQLFLTNNQANVTPWHAGKAGSAARCEFSVGRIRRRRHNRHGHRRRPQDAECVRVLR